MEQEREASGLKDLLHILFKHKYKILTVFLTISLTATIKTYLTTPVYQTDSSVMVKVGKEHLYRADVGKDQEQKFVLSLQALINTEIQILQSSDLIELVITDLGVENIYPDLVKPSPKGPTPVIATIKNATNQFIGQLSAKAVNPSNVINVSFKHTDPQVAALAVNKLLELYKEWHIKMFSNPKSSFMGRQLNVYRQRLEKSEKDLEAFKQKNRVFSIDEQRSHLINQRTEFDTALKTTQNRVHGLRQKVSSITSQMQTIPENIVSAQSSGRTNRQISNARAELLTLQLKKERLLAKYDESNRLIADVNKEIQLVKDFLEEHEDSITNESQSTGKNPVYLDMETDLLRNRAELRNQEAIAHGLQQQLNRLNGELDELDKWTTELHALTREMTTNEKNHETYLTKLEEARIEEEMDLSKMVNITVIEKAKVPVAPIEPRKKLNIAVGIILGAASGLALAFFSEYFVERGISTPEEVEKRLGLPVLATIHYKEYKKSRV